MLATRNGQKWSRRGVPGDYLSRNGRKWSRICSKFIGQWDRSHFDQLGSLYVATDCKMVPKWSTRHLLGCFFVTKWSGMVSESLVRPQRGQNRPIQSFGAPDPTPNWPQTAQDSPFAGSRPSQDPLFALYHPIWPCFGPKMTPRRPKVPCPVLRLTKTPSFSRPRGPFFGPFSDFSYQKGLVQKNTRQVGVQIQKCSKRAHIAATEP